MSATEAEALASPVQAAGHQGPRPFAPSWLDLLMDRLARVPKPRVVSYAILVAVSVGVSNAALWMSGLLPVGTLDVAQTFWGLYVPALLVTVHHLDGVARQALERFRPALGDDAPDIDRLAYELTVIPAVPALVILVILAPVTLGYYALDPAGSQVIGYAPAALLLRAAAEVFSSSIILLLAYHTLRQLRLVTRLHDMARRVDIFEPRPLHAFSQLTARTAIALVCFVVVPILVVEPAIESPNFWVLWAPWLVGLPVVGIVIFVAPMLGMHLRLRAEKDALQAAADLRLRGLLLELNEALDTRDRDKAAGAHGMLTALQAERDALARLPTWPWSAATLRGFASALVIPIVLFLIQRFLGAALGS